MEDNVRGCDRAHRHDLPFLQQLPWPSGRHSILAPDGLFPRGDVHITGKGSALLCHVDLVEDDELGLLASVSGCLLWISSRPDS